MPGNLSNCNPKPHRTTKLLQLQTPLSLPTFLVVCQRATELFYHWRELPQVSFLSRQKFRRDKHGFVAAFHVFCRDVTRFLSRPKYASDKSFVEKKCLFCRDKTFVTANIYRDKHNFDKRLWRQACFCRDKHVLATTKHVFCRDKSMLVETKLLSR